MIFSFALLLLLRTCHSLCCCCDWCIYEICLNYLFFSAAGWPPWWSSPWQRFLRATVCAPLASRLPHTLIRPGHPVLRAQICTLHVLLNLWIYFTPTTTLVPYNHILLQWQEYIFLFTISTLNASGRKSGKVGK